MNMPSQSIKVLVVGINPGPPSKNPNRSPTRERLEKWMSRLNIQHYSFCNTFEEVGPPDTSKIDILSLVKITDDYDAVIALGNFVSEVLHSIGTEHFKLPHPSPRNRLLNDKTYEANVLNECRKYLNV